MSGNGEVRIGGVSSVGWAWKGGGLVSAPLCRCCSALGAARAVKGDNNKLDAGRVSGVPCLRYAVQ